MIDNFSAKAKNCLKRLIEVSSSAEDRTIFSDTQKNALENIGSKILGLSYDTNH